MGSVSLVLQCSQGVIQQLHERCSCPALLTFPKAAPVLKAAWNRLCHNMRVDHKCLCGNEQHSTSAWPTLREHVLSNYVRRRDCESLSSAAVIAANCATDGQVINIRGLSSEVAVASMTEYTSSRLRNGTASRHAGRAKQVICRGHASDAVLTARLVNTELQNT